MTMAIFQTRACCMTMDVPAVRLLTMFLACFGFLQSLCFSRLVGEGTFILLSASTSQSKLLGFLAHLLRLRSHFSRFASVSVSISFTVCVAFSSMSLHLFPEIPF